MQKNLQYQLKHDWSMTNGVQAVQKDQEVYECSIYGHEGPRKIMSQFVVAICKKAYFTIAILVIKIQKDEIQTNISTSIEFAMKLTRCLMSSNSTLLVVTVIFLFIFNVFSPIKAFV